MMGRRKYEQGERIHSIDELAEQEFVWVQTRVYHRGWVHSWQLQMVVMYLKRGVVYKAIRIKKPTTGEAKTHETDDQ